MTNLPAHTSQRVAAFLSKQSALTARLVFALDATDPPPKKWSDLRYVFELKEDCNGTEAIQGHLEQCSILTPGWAQVRVGSCFDCLPGFLFPPTASVGLQTTPPSSCRGEPFQRHQAANVVGQVLQADLGARPHDADRSHDPTARRVLLRSEHMLDASAYPALGVVHSHLRERQRMVAPTASMNPTVVTTGPEFGLDLGRPISAVGEHIIAGVARVHPSSS